MGSINVNKDFLTFCDNIMMDDVLVDRIRNRYHAITKRINKDFWNSESENNHSLYVGSYGRGTAIYTSDVDIIVELPWNEYTKYDNYTYNGQSALLQAVRNSLMNTYSHSKLSADGQVVDISFFDGVTMEVVPAFRYSDGSGFVYPDTNNGGSWKTMNPKAEIDAFNMLNSKTNGNLKRLCRMIRAWNVKHKVDISGVLIDTLAYRFMDSYEYANESFGYYDWMSRDFFEYIYDCSSQSYWLKPGSNERVYSRGSFKKKALEAYNRSVNAIKYYSSDWSYSWHEEWREIYGIEFPAV